VFIQAAETPKEVDRRKFLFDLGARMAKYVSAMFPPDIVLEFEKVYENFLMLSKKCYIGMKYEGIDEKGKVEAKGFALVRRDFCMWVRETLQKVVDLVVKNRDIKGAIQTLAEDIDDLLQDRVDYEKIILTRKLAGHYKNPNNIHNKVAIKMNARTPGYGPQAGDRVMYVVLDNGCKNFYDKGEDWEYAQANKLPVDKGHYIECIKAPLEKMFKVFPEDTQDRINDILGYFRAQASRVSMGTVDLAKTFQTNHSKVRQLEVYASDSIIPRTTRAPVKHKRRKKDERPQGCADLAVLFGTSSASSHQLISKPAPKKKKKQTSMGNLMTLFGKK
jgi:DNA polymerase elongation subunit (family B)